MKRISGYLIGFTLVFGLFSTVGWLMGLEFLKNPFGQSVVMFPITAVSILMGSASFFLLFKVNKSRKTLIAGRVFAWGVLGVGLLKLLNLAGVDLGLDHWPYSDKYISANLTVTAPLVVITLNSALGFIITGISLLMIGRKGRWPGRIINYLAFTGFSMGTFTYIGYIYHVKEFYGLLPYMSVAPGTALCFLCFSLGMLFENSDKGFMAVFSSEYVGGRIARVLIPIGVLVPFIFGYFNIQLATKITYSNELSMAVLNTGRMLIVLGVLWLLARVLNNSDEKRQKAEVQLERQAQLFNITPDAVIYGDQDFTITSLNPVATRLFDVKEEEIAHIKLDGLFISGDTGSVRDMIQRDLWGEKGFWRSELDLITRTGQKINALVMFKAITNHDGEKVGWLAVYTDISPLRINEELKVANNYLEQLAFISAHDIKSPILTMKGLTDLMYNSGNISPADLQILDMQRKVIDEMQLTNKALNDILKLRKNLQAKDASENEKLPLKEIIANIAGILQSEIELSGATLKMEMNGVSEMKFPQFYFQSLFYNLLSNSIKYRDPGKPLTITFTGSKTVSNKVKFTIEDNGLGFDMLQNKSKIFGIFKRFHTHADGTGIGLHIVKSIVDAFNGSIEVDSEPGKGARFDLTFEIQALG